MSHSRSFISLILIVILLLPAASCSAVPVTGSPWTTDDLRLLDPAGDSPSPSTDLLAVYMRIASVDLEIRLDLLDIPLTPDYNLILYLDPSPPNSDPVDLQIMVSIPAQGSPAVSTHNPQFDATNIIPRVIRDPWLDIIVIRFNQYFLPQNFQLAVQTFHSLPDQVSSPDDFATNLSLDGKPPLDRASVLIAFTNTFPAATPAQALRHWDGAHTGPTGERHGLRLILDGVRANNIPVALLDLKTSSSIAALNYIGVLGDVRVLSKKGLLILPDVATGQPAEIALDLSRRAAKDFRLSSSDFVTAPNILPGAHYQFVPLPDTTHISISGNIRLIPLPATDPASQATMDGPSLEVRRALIDTALSTDKARLLVLGGSLPDSTWGQAYRAVPTFAWLAAHPWIHVLDENDLKKFPVGANDQPLIKQESTLLDETQPRKPGNAIEYSAWQTLLMLTEPTDDTQLELLHSQYIDKTFILWSASEWAGKPINENKCPWDFEGWWNHCTLSNKQFYAVIEPMGARLIYLFYLDSNGSHQLVAPSSQFAVGLSDPSSWKMELGEAADPSVIPGAFSDDTETWTLYDTATFPDSITFTSADGSRIKIFQLTESGLEVSYQVSGPMSTKIPLAVDPQKYFSGTGEYIGVPSAGSWTWGTVDGVKVQVRTDASISAISFTDSLPFLGEPEDPNLDYPPGHYLPFPLSLVTIHSDGNFVVKIGFGK